MGWGWEERCRERFSAYVLLVLGIIFTFPTMQENLAFTTDVSHPYSHNTYNTHMALLSPSPPVYLCEPS